VEDVFPDTVNSDRYIEFNGEILNCNFQSLYKFEIPMSNQIINDLHHRTRNMFYVVSMMPQNFIYEKK